MRHVMSVDVEEYFQVWALSSVVVPTDWERWPSRVEASTRRTLDLFALAGINATFFVLGWVAERRPALVRAIVDAGHELASHGQMHAKVTTQSPKAFADDVARAKAILEETAGVAVAGYRAPSFSIGPSNWWAYDVLAETGHRYSSSLHPIRHDHYGLPDAPRTPFRPGSSHLIEVPVATLDLGVRVSCAGGGHFRILPYGWARWCLARLERRDRQAGVFYFHPWEIDDEQPRVADLPWRSRLRHYTNLGRMEAKLARLLHDFSWDRLDAVIDLERTDQPRWSPAGAQP
jgi:polysaccharide deacetylase family protein (PEP-CTERM system associated)